MIFVREILRKFDIKSPPHHLATLPWEIQKKFHQYYYDWLFALSYLRIKWTVTVIVNLPIASKTVTVLPCEMQN